jgi:hypothetical protein
MTLSAVILTVLLFFLAGGVVVVAYSGTEQGRLYSLGRLGKRVFSRLKSTKTGQNISTPAVEKNGEFTKWLGVWRAGNQPNRTSIRRISIEKSNCASAARHSARAKITTAGLREANDLARTKHDFEEKRHAS